MIFFGVFIFIMFFSFNIRRNVFKDAPGDKRQNWTHTWRGSHGGACPKCGSNDVRYDYGKMIDFDTTGICNACGHTWVWQGSDKP